MASGMKLAIGLEKQFSKDQILAGYLNIVSFNANAYGIQAASQYFFSVDAKDLTVPQAALLAGLVKGPSLFDPPQHPKASKTRRDLVLDAMLQHGYINGQQHRTPSTPRSSSRPIRPSRAAPTPSRLSTSATTSSTRSRTTPPMARRW